jgi:hypothetical protein
MTTFCRRFLMVNEKTAELAETGELARQSDFVDEWNRSISVKAPVSVKAHDQPEEPDETTAEMLRQLESDGFVMPEET